MIERDSDDATTAHATIAALARPQRTLDRPEQQCHAPDTTGSATSGPGSQRAGSTLPTGQHHTRALASPAATPTTAALMTGRLARLERTASWAVLLIAVQVLLIGTRLILDALHVLPL